MKRVKEGSDNHLSFLLNVVIDNLDVREVSMTGRWFAWSLFPLVTIHTLARIEAFLDHAHILLTTGSPKPCEKRKFKFKLGCLDRYGFYNKVKGMGEATTG
jgi:hypothetical protein